MPTLQIRISEADKKAVEEILEEMGLDIPTAIRMYFKKITKEKSIPFTVSVRAEDPFVLTKKEQNIILQRAKDVKEGKNLSRVFTNAEDLIAELNLCSSNSTKSSTKTTKASKKTTKSLSQKR
jgi:DNA-damage-inducible protein J